MVYNLTNNLPSYTKVADVTVSVATTSVTIDGLNITKDDDYMLVSDGNNTSGSQTEYRIFFNGNTTATNYYTNTMYCGNTSINSSRQNYPFMVACEPSQKTFTIMQLKLANSGYVVYKNLQTRMYGSSSVQTHTDTGTSTFATNLITSITITATTSNAIGVGSRFQLYKCTATKLADVTLSTATSNVYFTGLSIDKNSEYMLVSDVINTNGSNDYVHLYPNGNTTSTNYYRQLLYAQSTSVGTRVENNSNFVDISQNAKNLSFANLKLNNNGYFVFESSVVSLYGASTVRYILCSGSSTFTTSSITSLQLSSPATFAVGSRFTLYKLK